MAGLAATVANQKDAVMFAAGMRIGDIGVAALDTCGDVAGHEQIKDAVNAVSGNPTSGCFRDFLGNIVGTGRTVETHKYVEDRGAQVGPPISSLLQRTSSRLGERWPRRKAMLMQRDGHHVADMDGPAPNRKIRAGELPMLMRPRSPVHQVRDGNHRPADDCQDNFCGTAVPGK